MKKPTISLIMQVANARDAAPCKKFKPTISDLKTLAGLALFHTHRMPAAMIYRLYECTQDVNKETPYNIIF